MEAIQIVGTSVSFFAGTSTGSVALPKLAGERLPNYVLVQCTFANDTHFAFGDSGITASLTTDPYVRKDTLGRVYHCAGSTHIALITVAANASVVITPVGI